MEFIRSGVYPLRDTVGIGGLPPPRAHLGPRGWWLRRHASLARLRLRLEHLRVELARISSSIENSQERGEEKGGEYSIPLGHTGTC